VVQLDPTGLDLRPLIASCSPAAVTSAAETQNIDEDLELYFGGPGDLTQTSKRNTYFRKYYAFCADTQVAVFPVTMEKFFRYVLWLPKHGINSGWRGVKNYTGALVQLNLSLGGKDPREENPELYAILRKRFKQNIQVIRTQPRKLAIRPAHVQALCLGAIDNLNAQTIADAASDTFMQFSAIRVGHVAPKAKNNLRHVLCWKHLIFHPSIVECVYIFIYVPTTKTRPGTELRPFWTAVGRVTSNPTVCPVRWMVRHFTTNYSGDPDTPIFNGPNGSTLTRATYQRRLQLRLGAAVRDYLDIVDFNVKHYTGISFRKGGITELTKQAAVHRILMNQVADFADHQDIATTRGYDEATIATRAGFSGMIGGGFAPLEALFSSSR